MLLALTFDDGPNTTTTPQVLDILEENQATASFFLIGDSITPSAEPGVRRALSLGCEICNHSVSHLKMGQMTPEEIDRRSEELSDLFATGLDRPEFSTRALNSLYNIGATTFGSLCAREEEDLFKIPMFGRTTFEGVVDALEKRGLFLGMIVPGFGASR